MFAFVAAISSQLLACTYVGQVRSTTSADHEDLWLFHGIKSRPDTLQTMRQLTAPCKENKDSGYREIFACGKWNPWLWNPEYSSRNTESHSRLESRIQVPRIKNPVSSTGNPEFTAYNPQSKTVLNSHYMGKTSEQTDNLPSICVTHQFVPDDKNQQALLRIRL